MKWITGYTTDYAGVAKQLIRTAKNFGIDIIGYPYEHLGSWEKNCQYKADLMLKTMNDFPGEAVVWIDADAEILRKPTLLLECKADMAVHFNEIHGNELMSGTLLLGPGARPLLEEWIALNATNMAWDQKNLESLLPKYPKLDILKLPQSYTKIHGGFRTVITHHNKSRNKSVGQAASPIPGVRRLPDGTYFLPRSDRAMEKTLDARYSRVNKHELRWTTVVSELTSEDYFPGEFAIVGKGPSLDLLTSDDFKGVSCVIAINEAVKAIEKLNLDVPLFGAQLDPHLKELSQKTPVFVGSSVEGWYGILGIKIPPECEKHAEGNLTVLVAIEISKLIGATGFRFLAFDSVDGNYNYAKSIGYSPALHSDPVRFASHKQLIIKQVGTLPYTFQTSIKRP